MQKSSPTFVPRSQLLRRVDRSFRHPRQAGDDDPGRVVVEPPSNGVQVLDRILHERKGNSAKGVAQTPHPTNLGGRQKTHLPFENIRAPEFDPFPRSRPPFPSFVAPHELPKAVVVRRKEGAALVDVKEVLERSVRDRKAVERGRSASKLVEKDLGERSVSNNGGENNREGGDGLGIA